MALSNFYTENTNTSEQSISSLVEMLPKDAFVRTHRSYIIAINKIDSYDTEAIQIEKVEIPIGRLYRHDVNRIIDTSALKKTLVKQSITQKNIAADDNS